MATISQTYTFVAGAIPTAAQWNSNWTTVINAVNGNLDADNVDTTVVATLATANTWTADQTFNDNVKVTLGSSGDADLYYDGTNVVLTTDVLGTGVLVVSNDIRSDTDSTDDLGSASVRWATSFQDDSVSRFTAHDPTIATDKTLSSTYNWGTFGPTTIGSGITVTVASGATWTVV